jgi:ligand-binding sensor domain-containing protein
VDIVYFIDKTNLMSYWVADKRYGLIQTYGYHPYYPQKIKSINGTNKSEISNIDVWDGAVAVSPSAPNDGGGTYYIAEGLNIYKNSEWHYLLTNDLNNVGINDINAVLFDRKDNTKMWASAWGLGLLEYKDEQLVAVYNSSNSPMQEVYPGFVRSSGLSMDKDGNLWIANSDVPGYINVRKKDGTFISFNFGAGRFTRKIMVDRNNFVWAPHERDGGLTVFKHNNFGPAIEGVNYRVLTKEVNKGNLESNSVFSVVEDKDGKIWVGTAAGIRVFYNPANIFTNSNYDALPIKIVQDGNVELLLEKETVTSIVVDGANNKWVGTQTGGLYCFSSDGLKEIYHFTKENSPLYSNNIVDLNYNKVTGDIFIGTELGLQSFRSGFIEGAENCKDIYAFPNPVKPNYPGNVFVRGVVDNSVVKITDESGNLVWEAKSQGGQVEWNLKNLSGSRATSGVYVVYAMSTTGEIKCLTKVLLVN